MNLETHRSPVADMACMHTMYAYIYLTHIQNKVLFARRWTSVEFDGGARRWGKKGRQMTPCHRMDEGKKGKKGWRTEWVAIVCL